MASPPLAKGTTTVYVSGATNSITPTGSAIATGDAMVLVFHTLSSAPAPTTPTGWTQRASQVSGSRATYIWTKDRADGESSYTVERTASGVGTLVLAWFPPSTYLPGTGRPRPTGTSEGNITTAPALTTTVANTVVLGIMCEATSATETTEPTLSGGTKLLYAGQVGSNIETIMLGQATMASPGTSAAMVTTYPNAQTTGNGYGYTIGLVPVETATPGVSGPAVEYWNGTAVVAAEALYWDGTTLKSADRLLGLPLAPITVDQWLSQAPSYMIHRGGSADWCEHTRDAYTRAVWLGARNLEASIWFSSDQEPFLCHDPDLSDMTNGTDTRRIDQLTAAQLDQVVITKKGSGERLVRLSWLLEKYARTHVITVEDKSYSHMAQLIAILERFGGRDRFMVKAAGAGGTGHMTLPNSLGYRSWSYWYNVDGNRPTDAAQASKVALYTTIGIPWDSDQATYTATLALGKPLIVHIVPSAAAAATAKERGGALVGMQIASPLSVIPRLNEPLT